MTDQKLMLLKPRDHLVRAGTMVQGWLGNCMKINCNGKQFVMVPPDQLHNLEDLISLAIELEDKRVDVYDKDEM